MSNSASVQPSSTTASKTTEPAPSTVTPNKLREIGIHGARKTGKTCYLACLYGYRGSDQAAVTFTDEQSIDLLKQSWETLQHGEVPDATFAGRPDLLRFALTADGIAWNVKTCEYAGSLVERPDTGAPELKREVRDWLKTSQAILFFLAMDDSDDDLREQQNAIDLVLNDLRELSSDQNTIGRPLALVLTKWDFQGPITGNPEEEQSRAREWLKSRPVLRASADVLEQCGDRVAVFPVSAFGSHCDGNKPPSNGPSPFNLHGPLVWALNKADEMLLDGARRKVSTLLAKRRWWSSYRKAIAVYEDLIREAGVNKGQTYGELCRELDSLRRRQRYRKGWITAAAVGALLVGLLCGWGYGRHRANEEYQLLTVFRTENPEPRSAADCVTRDESYLASRFCRLFAPAARWTDVRQWLDEDQVKVDRYGESQGFEALRLARDRLLGDTHGSERLALTQKYPYPEGEHKIEITKWIAEDQAAIVRLEETRDYEKSLGTATEAEKKKDYSQVVTVWTGFLGRHPGSPHRSEVDQRKDDALKGIDNSEWDEVLIYAQQHPRNHSETIDRATKYADRPSARHREAAQSLITQTGTAWDRAEYEKVRNAAREAKDSRSILATKLIAEGYIHDAHPRKAGGAAVQRWLNWFEGFATEKGYYINVKSVEIPRGSALTDSVKTESTRVYLQIGDTTHHTAWGRGRNPQIGETLGPFRFKWGQASTLEVRAEGYNYGWWNNWAKGSVTDDCFILAKANGPFVVTCAAGKDIPVYLECPAAIPPVIPPYPTK
jgi:hypothetical protein